MNAFVPNQGKYKYTSFGVVCANQTLRDAAVRYFSNYTFAISEFVTVLNVNGFADQDTFFNEVETEENQPYFAGINIKEFDTS